MEIWDVAVAAWIYNHDRWPRDAERYILHEHREPVH